LFKYDKRFIAKKAEELDFIQNKVEKLKMIKLIAKRRRTPKNAEEASEERRHKMSLKNAIQNGEGKNLEFKVQLPNSNALAKTIVLFLTQEAVSLLLVSTIRERRLDLNRM